MSSGDSASALGSYFEVSQDAVHSPEQPGRGPQRREALPHLRGSRRKSCPCCHPRRKGKASCARTAGRAEAQSDKNQRQSMRNVKKEPTLKSHRGLWLLSGCYTDIVTCWALDLGYQASPRYKVKWTSCSALSHSRL